MPLYTQCLNLCFLMATFCPSIAMQAIFGQGRDSYSFNLIGFLRAVLVYYALVLTGIYLLSPPIKAPLGHSDGRLLIIGFILSFVVLFVEVAFLHLSRCWQKRVASLSPIICRNDTKMATDRLSLGLGLL